MSMFFSLGPGRKELTEEEEEERVVIEGLGHKCRCQLLKRAGMRNG